MGSLRSKTINNTHYLSPFYYCHIFPNRRHGIIIRTLVVLKICCLSRLNSWRNVLDPARKRQAVMRMKFDNNKAIYPDFVRNVLDVCREDYDELILVDPSMKLPSCQLQELPCLSLVLLCLECIINLIKALVTDSSLPTLILSSAEISRESVT